MADIKTRCQRTYGPALNTARALAIFHSPPPRQGHQPPHERRSRLQLPMLGSFQQSFQTAREVRAWGFCVFSPRRPRWPPCWPPCWPPVARRGSSPGGGVGGLAAARAPAGRCRAALRRRARRGWASGEGEAELRPNLGGKGGVWLGSAFAQPGCLRQLMVRVGCWERCSFGSSPECWDAGSSLMV